MQAHVIERQKEIEIADFEIQRRERELDYSVRKPAEAEKFRLEKIAEAQKKRIVMEAEAEAEAIAIKGYNFDQFFLFQLSIDFRFLLGFLDAHGGAPYVPPQKTTEKLGHKKCNKT